jgi:hypothetical protein
MNPSFEPKPKVEAEILSAENILAKKARKEALTPLEKKILRQQKAQNKLADTASSELIPKKARKRKDPEEEIFAKEVTPKARTKKGFGVTSAERKLLNEATGEINRPTLSMEEMIPVDEKEQYAHEEDSRGFVAPEDIEDSSDETEEDEQVLTRTEKKGELLKAQDKRRKEPREAPPAAINPEYGKFIPEKKYSNYTEDTIEESTPLPEFSTEEKQAALNDQAAQDKLDLFINYGKKRRSNEKPWSLWKKFKQFLSGKNPDLLKRLDVEDKAERDMIMGGRTGKKEQWFDSFLKTSKQEINPRGIKEFMENQNLPEATESETEKFYQEAASELIKEQATDTMPSQTELINLHKQALSRDKTHRYTMKSPSQEEPHAAAKIEESEHQAM